MDCGTLVLFFGNLLFGRLAGEGPAVKQQPIPEESAGAIPSGDGVVAEVMPS